MIYSVGKKQIILISSLVVVLVLSWCNTNTSKNNQNYEENSTTTQNTQSSTISEQEKNGLIQMREEEKLARDVYKTLWEKWGNQIFSNIAQSEQTHTDAIKSLLETYKIQDPVVDDSIWSFTSPEMKKLYEDLISKWSVSSLDALAVWATIEDLDIYDLNKLISETDNEDIKVVYNNLKNGSINHINAFVNNITNNGGSYTPKYISQAEYEGILSSSQWNRWKWNWLWR